MTGSTLIQVEQREANGRVYIDSGRTEGGQWQDLH